MSHDTHIDPSAQIDDPEAGSTWVTALSGVILLAAIVVAICVFYFRIEESEVAEKVIDVQDTWLVSLKSAQMQEIATYQKYTVTAPDGTAEQRIRIPVSRAMELVIADAKNPPAKVASTQPASTTTTP